MHATNLVDRSNERACSPSEKWPKTVRPLRANQECIQGGCCLVVATRQENAQGEHVQLHCNVPSCFYTTNLLNPLVQFCVKIFLLFWKHSSLVHMLCMNFLLAYLYVIWQYLSQVHSSTALALTPREKYLLQDFHIHCS